MDYKNISSAILLISVLTLIINVSEACKGCVSLDEHNFEKIITRFDAVLVKFDVSYPYGDKHEVFTSLASELASNKNLLLAEVGIKDYGDKENEGLGEKYGITKDDLPAVRLFVRKTQNPVVFPKESDWTLDNLRNMIKLSTNIYIGLPGCLEKFDRLAGQLMKVADKKRIKAKAVEEMNQVQDSDKTVAENYIKYMDKVIEVGSKFVSQETARLGKILKEGKINEKKRADLEKRLNILKAFSVPKDEL